MGQIYLYDSPLLKTTLTKNHIKPLFLGHRVTTPRIKNPRSLLRGIGAARLMLDSDFYQTFETEDESRKFRTTWHHAAGVRGGEAVRLVSQRAAAWRTGSAGPTAATLHRPL